MVSVIDDQLLLLAVINKGLPGHLLLWTKTAGCTYGVGGRNLIYYS